MELDDLKSIWNSNDDFPLIQASQIATVLKGKSQSIIDKIKRNIWIEIIFTFNAGLMLLIYTLTINSGALRWTAISILLLFSLYVLYYIKKLMLLNRFDPAKESLKSNLNTVVINLTGYLKFYKRSYTILYPFYFLLSLAFIFIEQGTDDFLAHLFKFKTIAGLLLLVAVLFLCCTWVVDWFLKRLYGNHLEKLKSVLADLESSDDTLE